MLPYQLGLHDSHLLLCLCVGEGREGRGGGGGRGREGGREGGRREGGREGGRREGGREEEGGRKGGDEYNSTYTGATLITKEQHRDKQTYIIKIIPAGHFKSVRFPKVLTYLPVSSYMCTQAFSPSVTSTLPLLRVARPIGSPT